MPFLLDRNVSKLSLYIKNHRSMVRPHISSDKILLVLSQAPLQVIFLPLLYALDMHSNTFKI